MAAASVTPPGSLDLLQPGFSKALLGTRLEDKYLCSACKNVLRRPFQAQCGHRYCSCCLTSILSAGPQNCAACVHEGIYEDGVSILESSSAFPDNAARREVESLPAVCPSDGCTWKGTLKEYETRAFLSWMVLTLEGAEVTCTPSCGHRKVPLASDGQWLLCVLMGLVPLPACKGLVRLGEKEQHLEHECPERSLTCRHCRAPCCSADVRVRARGLGLPPGELGRAEGRASRSPRLSVLEELSRSGWQHKAMPPTSPFLAHAAFATCLAASGLPRLTQNQPQTRGFIRKLFRAHHQVCPKFPLTCDGCGKKKISRERVSGPCRPMGTYRMAHGSSSLGGGVIGVTRG
ncbi:hypothetical protein CB1_000059004 [Camelus ferus]|nr:hypothetical protein CB1_000059004 [Camelus ferus]